MTWISLALALVKLANLIFSTYREKALVQAGEDKEKLKTLQQMQAISSALKQVEESHARMTPTEIRKEIEEKGDFRDD